MSKEIANWDKQLVIYEQVNQSLKDKEPVLKRKMKIMTLWFGRQKLDDAGYESFDDRIFGKLREACAENLYVPHAGDADSVECYRSVFPEIIKTLKETENPLAVFIIATPKVAELGHTDHLPRGLLGYRFANNTYPTFVYKIIYGSGSTSLARKGRSYYTREEIRARKLEGIFVSFSSDSPSTSARRLIEIIKRILGYDLPGEEFPNYAPDEVEKIVWNANREDFNSLWSREGAIPKYPIVDGRPVFPL
jgi:hypothetical protein